jgi:type I restriction enzyme M protein
MVECVIGLGPNLFFNAPMEACIVICRTNKELKRRGKVLFINAVKEVTRKNAQSYLEESHIEHISSAYKNYADEENYARVVSYDEIEAADFSLNIPLYVRGSVIVEPILSVEECIDDWLSQSETIKVETDTLIKMLTQEEI